MIQQQKQEAERCHPEATLVFAGILPGSETDGGRVRRHARLFIAGEYPDKGVAVSEADLDTVIERFQAGKKPVAVISEHQSGPLDPLGECVALHREGAELFGTLCFSPGMDDHLRERGVRNLSVALVREAESDGGGYSLKEVSVVFEARVPGAGFLDPERTLAEFTAQGRVTPAMAPHLRKLLSVSAAAAAAAASPVLFADDNPVDIAGEVAALLRALPVVQPRNGSGGTVPAAAAAAAFNRASAPAASPAVALLAERFGVPVESVLSCMETPKGNW